MGTLKEEILEKKIDKLGQVVKEQSKVLELLHQVIDNVPDNEDVIELDGKVDKLSENIGQQSKTLNSLRDSIKVLAQVISPIHDAMKFIGEQRIEDCVYSRNGYCEHITKAISEPELSEEERSTTQKEGRYYPRVVG